MKRFILLCVFLISSVNFSQNKHTLSGSITDSATNESLIGATVRVINSTIGTSTNQYGFYSLILPEGKHTIEISYFGYTTYSEEITINENLRKNISLEPTSIDLDAVEIVFKRNQANIRSSEMSVTKLNSADIKKTPAVLGEADLIKTLLQLPGVTNAGEGTDGFNVRGGASDQNLILLDEATLYTSSHLFGFFSVFNPDVVKDLKLYKGGIPAKYGGRLSSVLDIQQKDGNYNNYNLTGGIGLIASRLMFEGPIINDTLSFLVAGRSSYAHLFTGSFTDGKVYFYDLNTKINYKFNQNNTFHLSGYFGRDVLALNETIKNNYGNSFINLRWNHLYNESLFSNLSFIYSNYYYGLTLDFVGFNWNSGITNYTFKYDFEHLLKNDIKLNYGINLQHYHFNPGEITPNNSSSSINPLKLQQKYAFEPALYLDVKQNITDDLIINYGARYSMFYRLGGQYFNKYENGMPVIFDENIKIYQSASPMNQTYYAKNKVIDDFNAIEPRISAAYVIDESQSIKASYNKMTQYLHLISNTSSANPLDVWAPSDRYLKPQKLDQYAIGYFKNFKEGDYALETEIFYKNVKNRVDYIDGADLIANDNIEQVLLNGKSRAYGLELLIRKNVGNLTGFVAYTLSKSQQKTPGRNAIETGINDGNWYNTPYDKTHILSASATYELNKNWSFGGLFTLQTGRPATYPNGYYEYQGINIPTYGSRNSDRLPTYHHLDVSATYIPKPEKTKGWQGEWVFSIYNLYNRKNAASISFQQNEDTARNEATKLSIFGIVPSVTYNFKF